MRQSAGDAFHKKKYILGNVLIYFLSESTNRSQPHAEPESGLHVC